MRATYRKLILSVVVFSVILSSFIFNDNVFAQDRGTAAASASQGIVAGLDAYCAANFSAAVDLAGSPGQPVPGSWAVPVNTDAQLKIGIAGILGAVCTTGVVQAQQKALDQINQSKESWWHLIIRLLIKRILDKVVAQTVRWIQGGGKPTFVTNWEDLITDSANKAFGDVLRAYNAASLCSPGFFRITQFLTAPPLEQGITCTFTQTVGNYQSWVNNFRNGGWFGWQQYWQPQNNPYGQLLLAWDAKDRQAALKSTAKTQEVSAGQGLLPVTECTKKETGTYTDLSGCTVGASSTCAKTVSYDRCASTQVVTPGRFVGDITSKALGSHLDFLVNSQDLDSAIAAIIDAALNRLIKEGLSLMRPSPSQPSAVFTALAADTSTNPDLIAKVNNAESDITSSTASNRTDINNFLNDTESSTGISQIGQSASSTPPPISLNLSTSTAANLSSLPPDLQSLYSLLNSVSTTTQAWKSTLQSLNSCQIAKNQDNSVTLANISSASSTLAVVNNLMNQITNNTFDTSTTASTTLRYSTILTQNQGNLSTAKSDLQACLRH